MSDSADMRRGAFAAVVLVLLAGPARTEPQTTLDVVCDLRTVLAGRADGGPLAHDGPTLPLTFRDQDPTAGRALMIVGNEPYETAVGMTIDKEAIVYLQEQSGVGKLLISTASKATPDGWPAVASQHGWAEGDLKIRVLTGLCRMRLR